MIRNILLLLTLCSLSAAAQQSAQYCYEKDLLPASCFAKNRKSLFERLPDSSIAVLFAAPVRNRSNDVNYSYHQDPDFYYLTGFTDPDAVLILIKDSAHGIYRERLLIHPRDPKQELWTGRMAAPEEVQQLSGILEVIPTDDSTGFDPLHAFHFKVLTKHLPQGVVNERHNEHDLFDLLKSYQQHVTDAGLLSDDFLLGKSLARLRMIKSPEELVLLQKAIDITVDGHLDMMRNVRPGMFEYQLEAAGEFTFHRGGAEEVGYGSICGAAENSVILHYEKNRRQINGGELILLDMGAEYHGYTADVTRTLPVNGTYTGEQRLIYDLVLAAQEAGIAACKTGNRFRQPHEAAFEVIAAGLRKLDIAATDEQTKKYFPHGTSHYLGLDVHDAGDFEPLREGQVITVEPGIYIPYGSPCDPKWWNIGIRIEDDILITASDPVILSGKLPRTALEIEKVIKTAFSTPGK